MIYEKKYVTKEDGRSLVYYHFPDTATEAQTAAFQNAENYTPSAPPAPQPNGTRQEPPGAGPEDKK